MRIGLLLCVLFVACAEKPHPEPEPEVLTATPTAGNSISFPQVDDNIVHDTLMIQTTFDLRDGSFLMIASHVQDDERQAAGDRSAGLRLHHYRLEADGSPRILASSPPAHDSWTMFPTFFRDPHDERGYILLANFGERYSWGQKMMRFNERGFQTLGFLNVAAVEQVVDEDEVTTRLLNIAPQTRITEEGDGLAVAFLVEEIMLFDDLRGGLEQTLAGGRVRYRWNERDGLVLIVDGEDRHEQSPG
jgi:hypothetical protein